MPLYAGRGIPLLLTTNDCAALAYRNIARRVFIVGDSRPDLLAAAMLAGQEAVDAQTRRFRNHLRRVDGQKVALMKIR